jgi:hypothetical protein
MQFAPSQRRLPSAPSRALAQPAPRSGPAISTAALELCGACLTIALFLVLALFG